MGVGPSSGRPCSFTGNGRRQKDDAFCLGGGPSSEKSGLRKEIEKMGLMRDDLEGGMPSWPSAPTVPSPRGVALQKRCTHSFTDTADDSDLVLPSKLEPLSEHGDFAKNREPLGGSGCRIQQDRRQRFDGFRQMD